MTNQRKYTQIKGIRQSTFKTGEAPTHLIGYNRNTCMWEVIASSSFSNYPRAKQWAYHKAQELHPTTTYVWLGCVSDEDIKHQFSKKEEVS